ncbi:hypothetical protein [Pyxidicoccus xibeiensis]|uniref:hypothetical protein n=1 Tax=Pyxidicoccus xibeiensis TaxID=2906759 RepID=UPI0020A808C0|nr:hypothetical protein [Pyxidicoccus xibeiensis]MCP3140502.1 hypothetical protein [Pyxidicoccus xibeiensis]
MTALVALTSLPALAGVVFFDTTAAMRSAAGYPISNRTSVTWAYANRSAEAVCAMYGYARGMYTGEQAGELMGVHCLTHDSVVWMDVPGGDIRRWAWWQDGVTNLDQQGAFYAQAAASAECGNRGYGTGFLTGFQNGSADFMGLNCIPRDGVQYAGARTDDTRFTGLSPNYNPRYAPWWSLRSVSNQVCQYYGYETGVMWTFANSGTYPVLSLGFICFS